MHPITQALFCAGVTIAISGIIFSLLAINLALNRIARLLEERNRIDRERSWQERQP